MTEESSARHHRMDRRCFIGWLAAGLSMALIALPKLALAIVATENARLVTSTALIEPMTASTPSPTPSFTPLPTWTFTPAHTPALTPTRPITPTPVSAQPSATGPGGACPDAARVRWW